MILEKNKLYLGVIIVMILISFLVWSYFQSEPKSESKEELSNYQYQAQRPQLISYSAGKKRWDIKSETIIQPKTENKREIKVILKNIKEGKLYSKNQLEYKVDAAKIVYFTNSKNIELYGDVCLEEIGGDKIFSDFFKWNEEQKNLKTEEGVIIEMDNGQLSAQKMKMNLETEVIDFSSGVTMTFRVKGAERDEE